MQDGRTIEPLISIYGLEVLPDDGHGDELFAGELSVTKAPSFKNQEAAGNFATILAGYIGQNPTAQIWGTPGVIFGRIDQRNSRASFMVKDRIRQIASGFHPVGAPDLGIEVVPPGTENVRRDQIVSLRT